MRDPMFIIRVLLRIKTEYGSDGSLESRLYLTGADRADAGPYSCLMPGMQGVLPATINISVTQGDLNVFDKARRNY